MAMTINPLGNGFGAEIIGADLTRALTPPEVKTIRDTVNTYAVVVIRDADISDEQQIRFSRYFGALELPKSLGLRGLRIAPELFDVSNLTSTGDIAPPDAPMRKFLKGNEAFHTDSTFNTLPTSWSLLSAHSLPPSGGNTEFADMRAVYEALDAATKAEIIDAVALHSLRHSRKLGGFTAEPDVDAQLPSAHQKMVRVAADGRPTLVAGVHAQQIIGWPEEKSRAFLDRIMTLAEELRFRFTQKWRLHDLLIWDNRCTMHRVTPFEDMIYKRDMRRSTLLEFGPDRSAAA